MRFEHMLKAVHMIPGLSKLAIYHWFQWEFSTISILKGSDNCVTSPYISLKSYLNGVHASKLNSVGKCSLALWPSDTVWPHPYRKTLQIQNWVAASKLGNTKGNPHIIRTGENANWPHARGCFNRSEVCVSQPSNTP